MTIEQDINQKVCKILDVIKEGGSSHVDVSGKADKVNSAVEGNIATLDASGNLVDSGVSPEDLVVANRAFPSSWRTQGTMANLIADINADSTAVKGTSYLQTVSYEDLPDGVYQAEMLVEIMESNNYGKVILFTVTSSNVSPYHWEYTSAWGSVNNWRAFVSEDDRNYIKKGTVENILNALKTAGVISNYTLTYNSITRDYNCTIN